MNDTILFDLSFVFRYYALEIKLVISSILKPFVTVKREMEVRRARGLDSQPVHDLLLAIVNAEYHKRHGRVMGLRQFIDKREPGAALALYRYSLLAPILLAI
jgi:hypothetical protein